MRNALSQPIKTQIDNLNNKSFSLTEKNTILTEIIQEINNDEDMKNVLTSDIIRQLYDIDDYTNTFLYSNPEN